MIVPKPPVKLEDHCSVIHDNTLFTYSANGFASIPLKQNGNWTELAMGEPVSGAACVQGAMGHSNKQAFYVIGGSGSSSKNYPGLQRYSFQDEKWETMNPTSEDMSNRTNHGAVYLKASSSIFVYAGNKDGSSTATSDTFVINTAFPQNVSSYSGADASPASSPVLLPWSDDRAALVGGATTGRKVHLFKFNGTGDWSDSGVVLPQELPKEVRCAMVNNNDGSKVLESFGMNLTPNTVDSLALVNSDGKALNPAKPVGTSSKKRRRAAVDNYPTYDGKFAASKTWSQYSLAQGEDSKLVVISGGSDRHSLAVFNQTSNSWMNSTKLFYGDQTMDQILPSTTSSTDPTATSSSSPSSTPPVSGGSGSSSSKTGTIVGATLGSVIGAAVIVIALIFCLRRKNKGNAAAQGKGSGDNKDRLSIQDQGIEPLTQSAYPMAKSQAPLGSSSVDSLAIFSGKLADEKKTQAAPAAHPVYGPKGGPAKSPLSTVQSSRELLSHQNTPTADKAFETGQTGMGGQPGDRRTDEGWTKYFQDNDVDNNTADTRDIQQDQPTASEDLAKSERRGSAWPMTNLTPLNFGFLDEPKPLGRVVTGSPTTEHTSSATDGQNLVIPEGQAARISSGDSLSLASDDNSEYDRHRSRYSSGMNDNYMGRPVSSMYSQSHYYNPSATGAAPIGYGYDPVRSSQPRRSSVIIPDTLEENAPAIRQDNANSDMSWLNLQADR